MQISGHRVLRYLLSDFVLLSALSKFTVGEMREELWTAVSNFSFDLGHFLGENSICVLYSSSH